MAHGFKTCAQLGLAILWFIFIAAIARAMAHYAFAALAVPAIALLGAHL
jgi:hypothetical protein